MDHKQESGYLFLGCQQGQNLSDDPPIVDGYH